MTGPTPGPAAPADLGRMLKAHVKGTALHLATTTADFAAVTAQAMTTGATVPAGAVERVGRLVDLSREATVLATGSSAVAFLDPARVRMAREAQVLWDAHDALRQDAARLSRP